MSTSIATNSNKKDHYIRIEGDSMKLVVHRFAYKNIFKNTTRVRINHMLLTDSRQA